MEKFLQRKKDVLLKKDKSLIGRWDKKIFSLCKKINSSKNYYTTSSCSGRITIVDDRKTKSPDAFKFVSHELIKFEEVSEILLQLKNKTKFKQESFILHIVCKNLKFAKNILNLSKKVGIRRGGIISLEKNIVIELIGSEKIEFPLTRKGNLIVEKKFLKIVIKQSNKNLKKSWETINKLEKLFII